MKPLLFLLLFSKCLAISSLYHAEECDVWEGDGSELTVGPPLNKEGTCKACYTATLHHESGDVEEGVLLVLKNQAHYGVLKREFDLNQRVDSPHVLHYLVYFVSNGEECIFAPRCDGDLCMLVTNPLPSKEIRCLIGLQVVEALNALHHVGIIHNDVTLRNYLYRIDDEGEYLVFLTDFGSASCLSYTLSRSDTHSDCKKCVRVLESLNLSLPKKLKRNTPEEMLERLLEHWDD